MKATTMPGHTARRTAHGPESSAVRLLAAQADIQPGHRILLVGPGPGHLARLLAERTGPDGTVVTAASMDDAPEHSRYDRIVLTREQWDLPRTWGRRLAPAGRLVVPLRLRGATHCIAFEVADGDRDILRSVSTRFVRATAQDFVDDEGRRRPYGARCGVLNLAGARPVLVWESGQGIDPAGLGGFGTQLWTGVTVSGGADLSTLWLWLAAKEFNACGLAGGTGSGLAPLATPEGTPAVVEDSTFAYVIRRARLPGSHGAIELGVTAFGPYSDTLGARLAAHLRRWRKSLHQPPAITVSPRRITMLKLRRPVIDRPRARIEISC